MSPRRRLTASLLGCLVLSLGCSPFSPLGFPGQLPIPRLPSDLPMIQLSLPDVAPGEALQSAIDELPEEGGILVLPEGVFRLERPIQLKSNVHLMGAEGQTVLKGVGEGSMFAVTGCHDVSLTRLVLDALKRDKLSQVILAADSERVGIYQCEIKNTGKDANGIELQKNVDQAAIIGNYLHDIGNPGDKWGTAITLGWGSSEALITDNRIENASRAGINAHNDCQDLHVTRNDIRKIRGEALGIELWSNCSGTVEYNQLTARISFDGSAGVIRHNVVDGARNGTPPRYGLEVVYGTDVQVLANHVTAAQMGVSIDKSNDCLFQGNVIEGGETGLQGYGAKQATRGIALIGNTFKKGTGRALMLNQNCDGWRIEGNLIEGYGRSGIYLFDSDDATITGNTLTNNAHRDPEGQEAAIRWHSDRKTKLFLSGNVLQRNREDYLDVPARFLRTPAR